MSFEIVPADTPDRIAAAKALFVAYAGWLERAHGISLAFQNVDEELAGWPGKYAPPRGVLLVAEGPEGAAGCVALRPLDGATCEIKRLYVAPEGRGAGLGRRLVRAIVAEARRLGYARAVLDTAGFMAEALRLYREAGFRDIPPYYDNPYPDMVFLGLDLRAAGAPEATNGACA